MPNRDPRDTQVGTRVNSDERDRIDAYAARVGCSRSRAALDLMLLGLQLVETRDALIDGRPTSTLSELAEPAPGWIAELYIRAGVLPR